MEKAVKQPGLYGDMMRSIRTSHSIGNTIRMLKLPVILTDPLLYAGAIANFYWLTKTLEERIADEVKKDPHGLVAEFHADVDLRVAAGYESDLAELYGVDSWREQAASARTGATDAYLIELRKASDVQVVAAAFILYGALVVGGGKATQRKVKRIFPSCEHRLFDVADNMVTARNTFREAFCSIGKRHPELEHTLVAEAARFMALNNTVVLSCRCLPFWWWKAAAAGAALVAVGYAWHRAR